MMEEYQEINKILHEIDDGNTKRKVQLVKNKKDGKLYVCKTIDFNNNNETKDSKVKREREYLFLKQYSSPSFSHLNIAKYIKHFETRDNHGYLQKLTIIIEYYEGGDLTNLKNLNEVLPKDIIYLFFTMLVILKEFKNSIIHRDIKPENIFFVKNGPDLEFYLGDMGSSSMVITDQKNTLIGTNQYMAPEIDLGGYTCKVDIYSLGKTMLSLITLVHSPMNSIFESLFQLCTLENFKIRPSIDQLIEFVCRQYDQSRYTISLSSYTHPNTRSIIKYFKDKKFNILKEGEKINFKIDIQSKFYNCISVYRGFAYNEYIVEEEEKEKEEYQKEENQQSIPNVLSIVELIQPPLQDLSKDFENVLINHINYIRDGGINGSIRSLLHPDIIIKTKCDRVKGFEIKAHSNITNTEGLFIENAHLIYKPVNLSWKKIFLEREDEITPDVQLKAVFLSLLVAFKISNDENDFLTGTLFDKLMEHIYFVKSPSLPPPSQISPIKEPLSSYELKISFPFNHRAHIYGVKVPLNPNYLNLFFGGEIKDTLISNLIQTLNILAPNNLQYKSILIKLISIILKEEKRILKSYSNLGLEIYFKEFNEIIKNEIALEGIVSDKLLVSKIDTTKKIEKIRGFRNGHSNSDADIYISEFKGKYYAIDKFEHIPGLFEILEPFSNKAIDDFNQHFKFISTFVDVNESFGLVYTIFELPSSLINSYQTTRKSCENKNILDKDKTFRNLLNQHLSYYQNIQNNRYKLNGTDLTSKKLSFTEYQYNIIISNDCDIHYYFSFVGKNGSGLVQSFFDIGAWVYGDENVKKIKVLSFFYLLQCLFDYQTKNTHNSVDIDFPNILYYLKKFYYSSLVDYGLNGMDSSSKIFNYDLNNSYSFIKIGFLIYNILDLYKPNIIPDQTLYYDSDLIVMLLENSSNKFLCFRKQYYSDLDKTKLKLTPENIVPQNNDNDNSIILLPLLIIKDDITSFHFFDYNLKDSIKTIEDFNNEKECLLYYLQNIQKNPSNANSLVLINLNLFEENESTDNESFLFFDIFYLIKQLHGLSTIIDSWDNFISSLSKPISLVSNYIQTNLKKILDDPLSIDILYNDESMSHFKPFIYDKIKEIKKNVWLIRDKNNNNYIRKLSGYIKSKFKEVEKYGFEFIDDVSISNPYLKIAVENGWPISFLSSHFKRDNSNLFDYLFNKELIILELLKEKGVDGISQLESYFVENNIIYILTKYHGDYSNLEEINELNQEDLFEILVQMSDKLKILESLQIYHRDIKPENILFKREIVNGNIQSKVCLIDFSISDFGFILKTNESGSKMYQAPEIYQEEYRSKENDITNQHYKLDIYSLGFTLSHLMKKFNCNPPSLVQIVKKMIKHKAFLLKQPTL
ncbi:hypothetical protein DDB_G0293292 [Dictyostelium discoideum AX4]|uniref:Probable serine/threonine-protein kinase DDB_G0293292 n=1 Tax=Dictyostelium discoideum TaxID=44689 RepID=Y9988_DICDI|nr:hypothetical protein DDB_G0293292 [Dictyostelium discoideum AX4]Q54C38.1 RecName: Full=Probable serine/threonine-protein kinase DDB_G0293292 [Dictyostelium discoideum]EAL60845.1 hypothetical protein DDB_G0293292 [Dictyostelium discoideum AX4]|eukprot:XP_629228.1 hypothetical protein DDB_G0293292 [Dictyostelium discoideum AX4]